MPSKKTSVHLLQLSISDFALQYRLRKLKADDCGDLNISGNRGDIYEYDGENGLFAATILYAPCGKHWSKYSQAAKTLGWLIVQSGDDEGTFLFNPSNHAQAELAIEAVRAPRKRQCNREAIENLISAGAGSRFLAIETQSGV
jgi:hypothetical protein